MTDPFYTIFARSKMNIKDCTVDLVKRLLQIWNEIEQHVRKRFKY